jgi:hypothetical protein
VVSVDDRDRDRFGYMGVPALQVRDPIEAPPFLTETVRPIRRTAFYFRLVAGNMNVITDSQRTAAKAAAIAFPISLGALAYANFGIRGALFATDDWAEKMRLFAASESAFRFSVVFDVVYCVGFIVLLTALYVVLSPVNRYLALVASASKFVYVATSILMALNFLTAVRLGSDPAYIQSPGSESVQALLKLNSAASWDQYYVGLVFWSLSSTLFAWLWLRSLYIPRGLALVGVVASAWCLFCALAYIANPAFSNVVNLWLFDMPMALFYISLSVWLLFRGLRGTASPVHE